MMPTLSAGLRGFYSQHPKLNPFPQPQAKGGPGVGMTGAYQPPAPAVGGWGGASGGGASGMPDWQTLIRLAGAQIGNRPGLIGGLRG